MPSRIFVNLPVSDLKKSMDFFAALGFSFDMRWTDEHAACMVINDHIYAMLLTEKRFKDFTKKEVANARTTTEVLLALDYESREAVEDVIKKAVAAGGTIYMDPIDYGFMYSHSFADLDGHQWEIMYIDEKKAAEQFAAPAEK